MSLHFTHFHSTSTVANSNFKCNVFLVTRSAGVTMTEFFLLIMHAKPHHGLQKMTTVINVFFFPMQFLSNHTKRTCKNKRPFFFVNYAHKEAPCLPRNQFKRLAEQQCDFCLLSFHQKNTHVILHSRHNSCSHMFEGVTFSSNTTT